MHENEISGLIIGAAIEVHREVGPGLIEKPYEEALCHELHLRGLGFVRQRQVPFVYKVLRFQPTCEPTSSSKEKSWWT